MNPPPLVSLWLWEIPFLMNFYLIKLIRGNPHNPSPLSYGLSSFLTRMAINGACLLTLSCTMHSWQQLPHHSATDTDRALTHESTSLGRGGSHAGKQVCLNPLPQKIPHQNWFWHSFQCCNSTKKHWRCTPPLPSIRWQWNDTRQSKNYILTSNPNTEFQHHFFISTHHFRSIYHYQRHDLSNE